MEVSEPSKFVSKIEKAGTDTSHGSYQSGSSESAMDLVLGDLKTLIPALVGKQNAANFRYDLALVLLGATVDGYDVDEIPEKIREIEEDKKEAMNSWKIDEIYGGNE